MKQLAYRLLLLVMLSAAYNAHAQTDVLHLKSNVTDTIFGHVVEDPYRWMEDPESESVKQWLAAQKKITRDEGKRMGNRYSNALTSFDASSRFRYTTGQKTGAYYFQMMNSLNDFDPFPILYSRQNPDDRWEIVCNPNTYRGHNHYSIQRYELSDRGGYLAVALSSGGSDWVEIRVHDMLKSIDLKDRIEDVRFSNIVWWNDGFFYAKYKRDSQTSALAGQQLYYHKLGNNQDDDDMLMAISASPGFGTIEFQKTSNGKYLVVTRNQKVSGKWYQMVVYKDLTAGLFESWSPLVQVPATEKAFFSVVDYCDSGFIMRTNYKAPRGRIFIAKTDKVNHFQEIIPQADEVLKHVSYVHHQIIAQYFTAGQFLVRMFNDDGEMLDGIKFEPGIDVAGFDGQPDDDETIFYEHMFYLPTMVNRYHFKTKTHEAVDKTQIAFNASDYKTEVVHYKSKDGTDVPMYLTYKSGLKVKGNNPLILYGYGGNNISLTPSYDFAHILLFENNGILAVPMIRGGGELGDEWHEAGRGLNKQNTFDDFVAAADFLKSQGYTSTEKLAIEGGSNGGLLVGAVITQHPEICKVAIAKAGVYDMLRYPNFTGGKYWIGEYGSPDSLVSFNNLLGYSPLHNVKPGINYPATLFVAGRNDDRVVPLHTYKFLARLQECSAGNNPHILYFEEEAGHNGATNYPAHSQQESFILAFIYSQMNLPLKIF